MIAERAISSPVRRYELEPELTALAAADARGVPLAGRTAELAALRCVGARNPSLGRIFEGHLNGVQLVARCGTPEQRAAAVRDVHAGRLFGVWNTQDDARALRIERHDDGLRLSGGKTWASGAGSIDRPIVTAAWPDGGIQMVCLRMEAAAAEIDGSGWRPLGMHDSDSFRVGLDGVTVEPFDLIGAAGDYERQPWFFGGALRFAAVHTGIVERIVNETAQYLRARGRAADPMQIARLAEMTIAVRTALLWLDAGAAAWAAYDADPSPALAAGVLDTVDIARTVVERAALDVIERAVRSVGARGLVEPEPFAALIRDLQMYLRQPAPDAALARIGQSALGVRSESSR